MSLEWIAVGLAGGALLVSLAIMVITIRVLRSVRRTEWNGESRLDILRDEQERRQLMHGELRMLEEELKWRRSAMSEEEENGSNQ